MFIQETAYFPFLFRSFGKIFSAFFVVFWPILFTLEKINVYNSILCYSFALNKTEMVSVLKPKNN